MRYVAARAASMPAATTPTPTVELGALGVRQATSSSASVTGDLPLTTVFAVPSNCLERDFGVMLDATTSGAPTAFRDYSAAETSCYPPSYSPLEVNTFFWYSPGVCPSGFAQASATNNAANSQPDLTLAWCCPSSMAFSTDTDRTMGYCSTWVATPTVARSGTFTTPVPFSNFVALQWPISVKWRSADLDDFTPASAPLLVAANSTISASTSSSSGTMAGSGTAGEGTAGSTTSGTGNSSATSSPINNEGLSTGTQVGIGVGVAVPCVALLVLGVWFLLYRRRSRRDRSSHAGANSPTERNPQAYVGSKAELPGGEALSRSGSRTEKGNRLFGGRGGAVELEPRGDGLNELEEQNKSVEPVELPGNTICEDAAVEAPTSPLRSDGVYAEGQTAARRGSRDPRLGGR